jgi:hypothetical protein
MVLFAVRGKGIWRWEDDKTDIPFGQTFNKIVFWTPRDCYLSRVQYWSRWHFAVQWPLQVTFHVYWRAADVAFPYERPKGMSIKKMFFAYGPVHRDADAVYWFPSGYIGGKWK